MLLFSQSSKMSSALGRYGDGEEREVEERGEGHRRCSLVLWRTVQQWKNGIESLLHSLLNLAVAPPSITNACPVIKEDCSLSARK